MDQKNKKVFNTVILFFLVLFVIFVIINLDLFENNINEDNEIKIGYFHGGRTILLYRAYINDYFLQENVNVLLITKGLYDDSYSIVPKNYDDIKYIKGYGKVTGNELVEEVLKGNFDCATIGESSFIMMASKGSPILGIAELGHDTKENPGHAIIINSNVVINDSEDLKGKTFASRRSSGGDRIFLREFLRSEGLDPDKDVKIIDDVPEDKLKQLIINRSIDGSYYHLMALRPLVMKNITYIYRKLDWINPEISQSILVCGKNFVEEHPENIEKVLYAYMKRIEFEHNLSTIERRKEPSKGEQKGLEMETDFYGLNLPQYDLMPSINITLLDEWQILLIKYKLISKKANLKDFIDNSFVERVYENLQEE